MLWMLAALALAEPLSGWVLDSQGHPVADATVEISGYRDGREVAVLTTDEKGRWSVAIARGSYQIRTGKPGLDIASRPVFVAPADGAHCIQILRPFVDRSGR